LHPPYSRAHPSYQVAPQPQLESDLRSESADQLGDRLLVIYDGYCGLCNASVQWLLHRDRRDRLRFAPSNNPVLAVLLAAHPVAPDSSGAPGSILVVCQPFSPRPQVFVRSRAVLAALRVLPFPWPAAATILGLVPAFLADPVYRLIARWRYRIWGRLEVCPIPTPADRAHFL
jgi:predicted DCC family thiol-disulfide oxidoreductase YuxK